jgi:hypothetical protein
MKNNLQILEVLSLIKENLESGDIVHTTYQMRINGERVIIEIRTEKQESEK